MARLEEHISPSLICADHCNLERDVGELEASGLQMLHVDIVDGYFSPSLPLGLDTVRQLRRLTAMYMDAHVMAMDHRYFIEELLDIGVQRLCFHVETERHVMRTLSLIKAHEVLAGVALSPATGLGCLDYALDHCDYVLLMMINPGFASYGGEAAYAFMMDKIADLRARITRRGLSTKIMVDGRVRYDTIEPLLRAGVDMFVAGTGCLFSGEAPLADRVEKLRKHMAGM